MRPVYFEMPEACIEYGTSFPCIRELHPCLARSDVQASATRSELCCSQDVPCFERAETGKLARRSPLDRHRASNGRVLAHAIPPTGFSRVLLFSTATQTPHPLTNALDFTVFLRPISSSHSFNIVLLLSLHTATAVNPPPPCRSLATILTCLTRVTVPDKPAETGFSLTCRRGRCFGL
jgi:hypothetical protein